MTLQTRTGVTQASTLREVEQGLAEIQQQHHTKQVEVAQLTRELVAIDTDPETWTGEMFAEREANRRNWTKQRAKAQQELMALQQAVETAKSNVQRLQARVRELPDLIKRLQYDLTREGRYGSAVYKAEQMVIIVQNQLTSQQQALSRLEAEQRALAGE